MSVDRHVAIVTVSDSCSRQSACDTTGPEYASVFVENKYAIYSAKIIPDNISEIRQTLIDLCAIDTVDIILFNGGTGISPTDVTPEAVLPYIEKRLKGLEAYLTDECVKFTYFCVLSRLIAGTIGSKLVFCFPGSKRAVKQLMPVLFNLLPHMIDLVNNNTNNIHKTNCFPSFDELLIVNRSRKSAYPLLSVEDAFSYISDCITKIKPKLEFIPIESLRNRVLCVNATCSTSIPPYDVSIKDGYAIQFSDKSLIKKVLGTSTAGDENELKLINGTECIRINTGAKIPLGADTVVQVEDTVIEMLTDNMKEEALIKLSKQPLCKGENIRLKGSDLPRDTIFPKGTVLTPTLISLMTAAGCFEQRTEAEWLNTFQSVKLEYNCKFKNSCFPCFKAPKVAILSGGDEISDATVRTKNAIHDSNRPLLKHLLSNILPKENIIDLGIAKDNAPSLYQKINLAFANDCDFLITSGGVSMGEKDLVVPILEKYFSAKLHFGRVFMKPGKPTCFLTSERNNKKIVILALPGNPASVFVTAHLFAIPAIKLWMQYPKELVRFPEISVKLSQEVKLDERPDFKRAKLVYKVSDKFPNSTEVYADFEMFSNQMSSCIQSCVNANLLLKIPPKSEGSGSVLVKHSTVQAILIQ